MKLLFTLLFSKLDKLKVLSSSSEDIPSRPFASFVVPLWPFKDFHIHLRWSWVDGYNLDNMGSGWQTRHVSWEPHLALLPGFPGVRYFHHCWVWPHLGHIWEGSRHNAFSSASSGGEKALHLCPPYPTQLHGVDPQSPASSLFFPVPTAQSCAALLLAAAQTPSAPVTPPPPLPKHSGLMSQIIVITEYFSTSIHFQLPLYVLRFHC